MGQKTLKRVPLDFVWLLHKIGKRTWKRYVA